MLFVAEKKYKDSNRGSHKTVEHIDYPPIRFTLNSSELI